MAEIQKIQCGLCHYEFDYGVHVCQGCKGDVVYGATEWERSDGTKNGMAIWGAGTLFALYALPLILNSQLAWSIPSGWGMGAYGLAVAIAAGIWGAINGSARAEASRYGQVRTFRRG